MQHEDILAFGLSCSIPCAGFCSLGTADPPPGRPHGVDRDPHGMEKGQLARPTRTSHRKVPSSNTNRRLDR